MRMGGGFVERIGVERFEVALVGVAQGLSRCRDIAKATIETVSLQARIDVPTFVHVLHYGVLFYSGKLTAMANPCCQSLAAAQARFPESKAVGGAMAH